MALPQPKVGDARVCSFQITVVLVADAECRSIFFWTILRCLPILTASLQAPKLATQTSMGIPSSRWLNVAALHYHQRSRNAEMRLDGSYNNINAATLSRWAPRDAASTLRT